MKHLIAALMAIALLLLRTDAKCEVISLWIEVQGTRCPPCARALEDAVKLLPGVTSAKFGGIAPQKLEIGVKKGEWVDLEKVWSLIQRQGYRVRKENTHLKLRGIALRAGDAWRLTLKDVNDKALPIQMPSRHSHEDSDLYESLSEGMEVEVDSTITVRDKQLLLVPHHIAPAR